VIEISEIGREKIVKIEIQFAKETLEEKPEKKQEKKNIPAKLKGGDKNTPSPGSEIKEIRVPPLTAVLPEIGQEVKKGDLLSEGHADLQELFRLAGKEITERYIIKEVQKIYSLQGAPIHDKHIEIMVRQMFSRVRIKDPGDTDFSIGEVVEKRAFRRANLTAAKSGRRPAKAVQLLMGISRVALSTSSFLSAASFQETSRVLIDAAIQGKEDELRGLKENVIIGRLIPAGTGYRRKV